MRVLQHHREKKKLFPFLLYHGGEKILRYKAFEPFILLGSQRVSGVVKSISVKGGGRTSHIYTYCSLRRPPFALELVILIIQKKFLKIC